LLCDDQPLLLGLLCNEAVVENGRAADRNPLDSALWESPATARQQAALARYAGWPRCRSITSAARYRSWPRMSAVTA